MKKNNLSYYSHQVASHNHWKFKLLRKQYGWAGEGKFWALNNIIGESHNCFLDIADVDKAQQIAADLDFELDEFLEYLTYLEKKCKLIKRENELFTTDQVQSDLKTLTKTREADRKRKAKIHTEF